MMNLGRESSGGQPAPVNPAIAGRSAQAPAPEGETARLRAMIERLMSRLRKEEDKCENLLRRLAKESDTLKWERQQSKSLNAEVESLQNTVHEQAKVIARERAQKRALNDAVYRLQDMLAQATMISTMRREEEERAKREGEWPEKADGMTAFGNQMDEIDNAKLALAAEETKLDELGRKHEVSIIVKSEC